MLLKKCLKIVMYVFILFVLIPSKFGFAHSNLEKTYPIDREQLTKSPSTVELWFEDPVVLHDESITLEDNTGTLVKLEQSKVDQNDKSHIITDVPKSLPEGKYTVKINVIALDGFVIQEKIDFEVIKEENKLIKQEELKIVKYSPEDGEIVTGSPQKLNLWFNQPAEITAIGLFDDRQQSIPLSEAIVDPNDSNHIIVEIGKELSKGTYQVTWYAHPEDGDMNQPDIIDVFYFAVDEFTPIQQVNIGEPTNTFWFKGVGLKQLSYWLVFIGISVLFGGTFLQSIIARQKASQKWFRISFVLFLVVILAEAIILVLQKGELGNLSLGQLLSVKFIWIPLLQITLLMLGLIFSKMRLLLYGVTLLLVPFITGHASYPRYGGYLTILVSAIHLIAASIWIGGLFGLFTLPKKEEMKEWLNEVIPKYSRWALISLITLIATGLFMTFSYIPSFSIGSFVKSEWGKAIIIKSIITLVVIGIGYFQRRTIKRLTNKAFPTIIRRLSVEMIYGLLILLFASILVVSTPSAAEQGVYPTSKKAINTELNVNISPLYPGLNVLTMEFGTPEIERVEVTITMPPSYNVTYNAFEIEDNVFKITGNLLHAAGTMTMQVKAIKVNGEESVFDYKIVIPGEMRFNE
ncbi:MAG: copper resistance protein CopC [Bacillota bacterium]|nr:copper resistance protein CopC [Bacillota bacterium]